MSNRRIIAARRLGIAAAAAFTVGLVAAPSAASASTHPPAPASVSVANGTLIVTGTDGPDQIALSLDPTDPTAVVVDLGAGSTPQSFDHRTFTAITVSLGNDDDSFQEQQGAFAGETVTIDAGSGDDIVVGGDGNDTIFGGGGNDTINSGKGDDLIFAGAGRDAVDGGVGHDVAFLESGRDSFQWDPGDGSDVVEGGEGVDKLVFNGSSGNEVMSLSANGTRSVFLRDLGLIRMDMNSVELLDLAALGGTDSITVNDMTGTGFRHANVDLGVQGVGDGQADVVTVNGTENADQIRVRTEGTRIGVEGLTTDTRISGQETADRIEVNGLGGNDAVHVDRDVPPVIGVAVDLGAGQV